MESYAVVTDTLYKERRPFAVVLIDADADGYAVGISLSMHEAYVVLTLTWI